VVRGRRKEEWRRVGRGKAEEQSGKELGRDVRVIGRKGGVRSSYNVEGPLEFLRCDTVASGKVGLVV